MEAPRAQMERELADLRSRYTAYVRSATRMRMLIMLSGTVFVACLIWIAERFLVGDGAAAVFLVGLVIALLIARWLASPHVQWRQVFLSAVLGKEPDHASGSASGQTHLIQEEIARLERELKAIRPMS